MRHGYRLVLLGLVALVLAGCGDDDEFEAELTGGKERPTPVSTSATGTVEATLEELTLTVAGTFEGLSGPATGAHIHGPASEEEAAGILCPLVATADRSGTVIGTCLFTEEQVDQLRDGRMYVNVHTAANPAGEIRGQLE
ncbi:MAG TPA: CHRD domain-containing protein [Aggregicoccus sp.]|nr:CHRD domain-containing protein [Aggregicoccus sp.]